MAKKLLVVITLVFSLVALFAEENWYTFDERLTISGLYDPNGIEKAKQWCRENHDSSCKYRAIKKYDGGYITQLEHTYFPNVSIRLDSWGPNAVLLGQGNVGTSMRDYRVSYDDKDKWLIEGVELHGSFIYADEELNKYVKAFASVNGLLQFNYTFYASMLRVGNTFVVFDPIPTTSGVGLMRFYKTVSQPLRSALTKYNATHTDADLKAAFDIATKEFLTPYYFEWETGDTKEEGRYVIKNVVDKDYRREFEWSPLE